MTTNSMNDIDLNISIPINNSENQSIKKPLKADSKDKSLNTLIEMLNNKTIVNEEKKRDKKINDSWLLFTLDPNFKKQISEKYNVSDIDYEKFKKLYLNNSDALSNIYEESIKSQDFLI